ncbi:HU domain-containing protein [Bacteroidetes bacterium endosymbiont of Geopemphigus sp.]
MIPGYIQYLLLYGHDCVIVPDFWGFISHDGVLLHRVAMAEKNHT